MNLKSIQQLRSLIGTKVFLKIIVLFPNKTLIKADCSAIVIVVRF